VGRARSRGKALAEPDLRSPLAERSSDEVIDLVLRMAKRDRAWHAALVEECTVANAESGQLVAAARKELRAVTSLDPWMNHWKGIGNVPDYAMLERQLDTLVRNRRFDDVVELGEELVRRGLDQVARSDDDGLTAEAIANCMPIVCRAWTRSGRPAAMQLLGAIDVLLSDDFGVCEAFEDVLDHEWGEDVWSSAADELRRRLDAERGKGGKLDWSARCARIDPGDRLIHALDQAGRSDEATELAVKEADATEEFPRAVERLIEVGRLEQAEELARTGLRRSHALPPGPVSRLEDLLCEIAASRGDRLPRIALVARRFFESPDLDGFQSLAETAMRTEFARTLRATAIEFLETGRRPDLEPRTRKMAWPLPEPPGPPRPASELEKVREREATRHRTSERWRVLIELGLVEGRHDDALAWFDRLESDSGVARGSMDIFPFTFVDRLATAVETTHPDRAIALHVRMAHQTAALKDTRKYRAAAERLRRIRSILEKAGRDAEWPAVVDEFRSTHERKWRLLEILDETLRGTGRRRGRRK